ncbi:hypothetical protein C8R47DRAFT_1080918 [Mycena vitilis]|nr:hypothetical protein C8R47DRAFT_1080918 [Mycena vitilis]
MITHQSPPLFFPALSLAQARRRGVQLEENTATASLHRGIHLEKAQSRILASPEIMDHHQITFVAAIPKPRTLRAPAVRWSTFPRLRASTLATHPTTFIDHPQRGGADDTPNVGSRGDADAGSHAGGRGLARAGHQSRRSLPAAPCSSLPTPHLLADFNSRAQHPCAAPSAPSVQLGSIIDVAMDLDPATAYQMDLRDAPRKI